MIIACLILLPTLTMKNKEELLEDLHRRVAEELIGRIADGEASAAELGVAVKFLKDNGMDVSAVAETPVHDLANIVPFKPDEAVGG